MRVLLVEDEPGVSEFVQQGLTEAGYAVDVAYDGVEGLNYALAAEYDVMILIREVIPDHSVATNDWFHERQFQNAVDQSCDHASAVAKSV